MSPELEITEPGRVAFDDEAYDLFEFDRCIDFHYKAHHEAAGPRVECTLTLSREDGFVLQLHLDGVSHLRIPEIAPAFWISELQVVDVRRSQLEGVRYTVQSEDGFACNCRNVRFGERGPGSTRTR
jgi:hypothetical protein